MYMYQAKCTELVRHRGPDKSSTELQQLLPPADLSVFHLLGLYYSHAGTCRSRVIVESLGHPSPWDAVKHGIWNSGTTE